MLFISVQLKQSQAVAFKFDNVVPFATVTGVMGLFNQNDGKVYLYDGNFQNCVSVLQLEELGKAMKPVENKQ
jgi:hypothetical protein